MFQPRLYREVAYATDLHCANLHLPTLALFKEDAADQLFVEHPELHYDRTLPAPSYEFNLPVVQSLWHDNGLKSAAEILNKTLLLEPQPRSIATLLPTDQPLHLIGFKNNWRSKQRDVLRYIAPGEWYLGTSHHNLSERYITRQGLQSELMSRAYMNLSIDHIRHYIGVCDTSHRAGVVAVDTPRHYAAEQAAGHINPKEHPSLLWRLRFPTSVTPAQQRAYLNNIRTWTMLLHKVVQFADRPNGSDALQFSTWTSIQNLGANVLETLQYRGREAVALIDASKVQLMEASLHLPLNLGLNVPLNQATITELYGVDAWFTVQRLVRDGRRLWRAGRIPDVYSVGAHQYVQHSEQHRMIQLELAPDWLKPLSTDLILKPWGVEKVLMNFLQILEPEWNTTDWHTCNQQADILTYLKPTLLKSLGIVNERQAPPELVVKFDELISTIRTRYPSHQELIAALQPIFVQIESIVRNEQLSTGHYLPVAYLLHLRHAPDQELGLEMLGQLFHIDLLSEINHKSS